MISKMEFRTKARVVGFADLILTSSTLFIVLVLFTGLMDFTVENDQLKDEIVKEHPEISSEDAENFSCFMTITFWLTFILYAFGVFLQITAAIKLINATQIGKGALSASKLARFWRNVTIVFTVFIVPMVISDFNKGITTDADGVKLGCKLLNFIVRIFAIHIVQQFIKELDHAVATSALPVRQGQVPMSDAMLYSPDQQESAQLPNYMDALNEKIVKEKV